MGSCVRRYDASSSGSHTCRSSRAPVHEISSIRLAKGYCRPVNCITRATRSLSYKRQGRPLMGSFGGRKWPLLRAVSRAFLSAASENEGCHVSMARTPAQCDGLCRVPRRCDLSPAGQGRRAIALITSRRRARLYRHTQEHKRSHFALSPDASADTGIQQQSSACSSSPRERLEVGGADRWVLVGHTWLHECHGE
jgi:hypothetical protein